MFSQQLLYSSISCALLRPAGRVMSRIPNSKDAGGEDGEGQKPLQGVVTLEPILPAAALITADLESQGKFNQKKKQPTLFCVKQMCHQKCFCLTYHWVSTEIHTWLQVCVEILYGLHQGFYNLCTSFIAFINFGKLLQRRAVAHGDTEYLTKACLKRKRERNLKNAIRNWVDVVENFSVAYLRLPFEALRITLIFGFNPGRLNWDLVNVCGLFSCLIFKKCMFNFIWFFLYFLKWQLDIYKNSLKELIEKMFF